MTMFYPNQCYNKLCYKGDALYIGIYAQIEILSNEAFWYNLFAYETRKKLEMLHVQNGKRI